TDTVDHVVEAALQRLQQQFAGDALGPVGRFEVAAELVFEHAIRPLDLLLLTQLDAVAGHLRATRPPVLAGGHIALFDRALLRVAALSLDEQRHAFTPAQAADRSDISRHTSVSFSEIPTQTRRRFDGRHPLCGIGVTSRIDFTSIPTVCSARIADSRPAPGPLTFTSTE